jgi:CheY-like chemotaxis protein
MDSSLESRPILVIDDDPDVGVLLEHLFRESGIVNPLRVIMDVAEALRQLEEISHGDASELPLLILIDLKMPKISGLDVLAWLRGHPAYKHVPRIVLSSSLDDRDVTSAQALGATGFLTKFPSPAALAAIMRFARDPQSSGHLPSHFPELQLH